MAWLAALAIAVGGIAALRLPLLSFGVILLGTTSLGVVFGLVLLPHPREVLVGALLLFSCVQIGFGLGHVVVTLSRNRKNGAA